MQDQEQYAQRETLPLCSGAAWYLTRDIVNPHHCNISLLQETPDTIDPFLLKKALQLVIAHHDGLRIRYEQQGTEWQAYITGKNGPVPFLEVDLASYPQEQQSTEIEKIALNLQSSLNLYNGPVLQLAQRYIDCLQALNNYCIQQ